jgi:hypothetical protein
VHWLLDRLYGEKSLTTEDTEITEESRIKDQGSRFCNSGFVVDGYIGMTTEKNTMTPEPAAVVERSETCGAVAISLPRLLAAIALFSVAGLVEARHLSSLSSIASGDVWWHLRTGFWILQNHALPHTGLFSQAAEQPWMAVSWIFDVKLAVFYRMLGLRTIPIFATGFKAGLAVVTFLLARGHRGNFWAAVVISAVAQYVLGGMAPAPVYGSVLFFGIELLILLESRQSADRRWLLLLPVLFLLWANADVYFVYGLGLLVLFVLARVCEEWWGRNSGLESEAAGVKASGAGMGKVAIFPISLFVIAGACFVATLVTPYFYGPYEVFFARAFSTANPYLAETYAPGFRQPQDYVLVLFVMAGFLALGLRRSRDIFLIALLAIATALAFHSQRDIWVVVLAVSAVMGETLSPAESRDRADRRRLVLGRGHLGISNFGIGEFWIATGSAIAILVLAVAVAMPRSEEKLLAKAGESYPVGACNYIRENHLPQPIFNSLEWGGFLTWYLPEYPVAIDERIDLYGGDFFVQYSQMMNAGIRYTEFAPIANAQTIVLPRTAIMAQALGSLPGYKVVYSDEVAVVVRKTI